MLETKSTTWMSKKGLDLKLSIYDTSGKVFTGFTDEGAEELRMLFESFKKKVAKLYVEQLNS